MLKGSNVKKIVLTGAAGRLGSYLREPLTKLAAQLVSTDINSGDLRLLGYPDSSDSTVFKIIYSAIKA